MGKPISSAPTIRSTRFYALEGPDPSDKKAPAAANAKEQSLAFHGTAEDKRSTADVIYTLDDDARWLKITTRVKNTSTEPLELNMADAIRADGEFEFGQASDLGLFWAYDPFWRQGYGSLLLDPKWTFSPDTVKQREHPVLGIKAKETAAGSAPGETREVVRYLFPAANLIDVLALARQLHKQPLVTVALLVKDGDGPVADGDVEIKNPAGERLATAATDEKGSWLSVCPPALSGHDQRPGTRIKNDHARGRQRRHANGRTSDTRVRRGQDHQSCRRNDRLQGAIRRPRRHGQPQLWP